MSSNTDNSITDFSQYQPRMKPNKAGKLNSGRTVMLSLSFFTVLMAWSYFNFKVPLILDGFLESSGVSAVQTTKGTIMALDNLVGVIFQPFFGSLSDRTRSKYGRRMPFIIIGTFSSAVFFIAIPLVQVLAGLVVIIFLFDFSMAIFRSISIAILPDYTVDKYRSKASAIQQFIANMGGVLAFAIPMITGLFTFTEGSVWVDLVGFVIVAVAMVFAVILQIIFIKETPTGEKFFERNKVTIEINPLTFSVHEKAEESEVKHESGFAEIKTIFRAKDKSFRNMLFVVFFAYTGFAAVEAFFSSFVVNYMGKAESLAGTLFMAYSVPMILTAYFWGLLGQKIGRKKAARFGLIGIVVAVAIFSFVVVPNIYNPVPGLETTLDSWDYIVMINLACVSMPWMCFIVNSFPIIWGLAPKGKIGTYTGIYYTFNQFAYSWAPILAGLNLDFLQGEGSSQYQGLFPLVLVCMVLALIFMFLVKSGGVNSSQEEIEEYEEKY
jgi:Na+/melibiose symporter-like transporter